MRARDVLGVVDIERSNLSLYEERATLELPLSKATRIVRLYLINTKGKFGELKNKAFIKAELFL